MNKKTKSSQACVPSGNPKQPDSQLTGHRQSPPHRPDMGTMMLPYPAGDIADMQCTAELPDGVAELLNDYTNQGQPNTAISREAVRVAKAAFARTKQIIRTNPRTPP